MNRSELASAQTLPLSPYRGQEPGELPVTYTAAPFSAL